MTPVVAHVVPVAVTPATAPVAPSASAVKAEVQTEVAATISRAAAPDNASVGKNAGSPGAGNRAAKAQPKLRAVRDEYVAPPWTKWYGGKKAQGSVTAGKNQAK
jgi:hypothetical protein